MLSLCGVTVINKNLNIPTDFVLDSSNHYRSNIYQVNDHDLTPSEFAIEYGARLCYNSVSQIGTKPHFIKNLVQVGHLDVLEHAAATFSFESVKNINYKSLFAFKQFAPYTLIEIVPFVNEYGENSNKIYISANLRVWLQIVDHIIGYEIDKVEESNSLCRFLETKDNVKKLLLYLYAIAPKVFSNVATLENSVYQADEVMHIMLSVHTLYLKYYNDRLTSEYAENHKESSIIGHQFFLEKNVPESMHHATYLITDVSRAYTHQHVRHRLLSHCLAEDTIIYSFSGKKWTIKDLFDWSQNSNRSRRLKLIRLRAMNDNGEIVPVTIKSVVYSGKQQVYKLTTESGRNIRATGLHRFKTPDGWKILNDLSVGDMVYANEITANLAFKEKIVSIEKDEVVDTYDIEINEDCHNFVANGLVVHNSQMSQRYVDFSAQSKDFIYPLDINEETKSVLQEHFGSTAKLYDALRDKDVYGLRKEDARCILPNATATSIVSSGYDQGWRHYFKLRVAKDAQKEIRLIATKMQKMYEGTQWHT
jgi:thymidylate synthase ThyX